MQNEMFNRSISIAENASLLALYIVSPPTVPLH